MKKKLTKRERALIRNGFPIAAIKEVRARTGLGLKESKELVVKYLDTIQDA